MTYRYAYLLSFLCQGNIGYTLAVVATAWFMFTHTKWQWNKMHQISKPKTETPNMKSKSCSLVNFVSFFFCLGPL